MRAFLKANNRTQEWLASELGVTPAYVSQILSGVRKPSLNVASRLETITGVPAREFSREVA